ncbi:unnamed protein product [Rotaria sp. Silwood1]|nr:unnamed protein product [Rotaria sp. Silwood1]
MFGLLLGDALGAHVEFRPHAYLLANPVSDLQSGGTWGLEKGQVQAIQTSIRPDYKEYYDDILILQWLKSLKTSKSIAQHVAIFEQNLCQLVEELKEFTFLDIYGEIHYEKIEPYRLMVQARFPNSRIDVAISRFRLWL